MLKSFHLRDDFSILLYKAPKRLSRIKKYHKFSKLVFIAQLDAKCTNVKNHFHISDLYTYTVYVLTEVCHQGSK